MTCNAIPTGNGFLEDTLAHIDCQAQTIGNLGFLGLSEPGSPYSGLLTGLLAIFIALFGIRLLFGYGVEARDVVSGFLKIGIVLTLATSWGAYGILVYDTVLHGPAELAAAITGAGGLPGSDGNLASRLQAMDGAILELTALGSGRFQLEAGASGLGNIRQIAVSDEFAFGFARIAFLSGTIGALSILRLAGGILIALAPLFAGLLLFDVTRSLFIGWLKGLVLVLLGSLAVTIALGVELALLEPWITNVLNLRLAGYGVPSAPSELLAIAVAFFLVLFLLIAFMSKIAFATARAIVNVASERAQNTGHETRSFEPAFAAPVPDQQTPASSRSFQVIESVRATQKNEQAAQGYGAAGSGGNSGSSASSNRSEAGGQRHASASNRGGSSSRRTGSRVSRAGQLRDKN